MNGTRTSAGWSSIFVCLFLLDGFGIPTLFGQRPEVSGILPDSTVFLAESDRLGRDIADFLQCRELTGIYGGRQSAGKHDQQHSLHDEFSLGVDFFSQFLPETVFDVHENPAAEYRDNETAQLGKTWESLFPGQAFYALVAVKQNDTPAAFQPFDLGELPQVATGLGMVSVFGFETNGIEWNDQIRQWTMQLGVGDSEVDFRYQDVDVFRFDATGLYWFQFDGWFYGVYSQDLATRWIDGLKGKEFADSLAGSRLFRRLDQVPVDGESVRLFLKNGSLQEIVRRNFARSLNHKMPMGKFSSTIGTRISASFDRQNREIPLTFRITRGLELPVDERDSFIDNFQSIQLGNDFPFPSRTQWSLRFRDPEDVLAPAGFSEQWEKRRNGMLLAPNSLYSFESSGVRNERLAIGRSPELTAFSGGYFSNRGAESFHGVAGQPIPEAKPREVDKTNVEDLVEDEIDGLAVRKLMWGKHEWVRQITLNGVVMNIVESSAEGKNDRWGSSIAAAIRNGEPPNPVISFSWIEKQQRQSRVRRDPVLAEISRQELPGTISLLELTTSDLLCGSPMLGSGSGATTRAMWERLNGFSRFSFFEDLWFRIRFQIANSPPVFATEDGESRAAMYALHYRVKGQGIWETDGWIRLLK